VLVGSTFLAHAPFASARIAASARALEVRDGDLGTAAPIAAAHVTARADQEAVERAERRLATVPFHDEAAVFAWMVASPENALVAIALLADRPRSLVGERLAELFPELAALGEAEHDASHEHEPPYAGFGPPKPLVDHAQRALTHALAGPLPADATLRAVVVTALLFADVGKGGTRERRASWRSKLGLDGSVHNADSAVLLRELLARLPRGASRGPTASDRYAGLAVLLTGSTGLVGMRLRGEVQRRAFRPLVAALDAEEDGGAELVEALSIVDRCDTAAVRSGLWTASLAEAFRAEQRAIADRDLSPTPLAERFARMRKGALAGAEDVRAAEEALSKLGAERAVLERRMEHASTWYAEAALGCLGSETTARVLLLASGMAARIVSCVERSSWHLDLHGLVRELRHPRGETRTYPARLLEALLLAAPLEALGRGELASDALAGLRATKGVEDAVVVTFAPSPEASALLTLLEVYERKEAAVFHTTLKSLCDLYGLRKDDFDRVSNEANYLVAMNAARSDKARMLDLVVPGCVVEVGPGGGVVLDLLEERFPSSRIVGLDVSSEVVRALEDLKGRKSRRWEVRHGDAFELPTLFGPGEVTTVVYCSVLHEIFSYVPWSDDGEPKARFRLGSVLALLRASFRALAAGGRIVVRDGVRPEDRPMVVELVTPAWREGLVHFARVYEARPIPFEVLAGDPARPERVRIAAPDLFEFLTTFTWGPASFPYEVREQRGVLPRGEYVRRALAACTEPGFRAREVPVPPELASYLQPGYPQHILPHVRLFEADGTTRAELFHVNGVWAIEKERA